MDSRRIVGDCREVLKQLIAEGVKVQMCVTSPPYFGLRDYGTGTWEGGDGSECEHKRDSQEAKPHITKYGTVGNANTNWDHRKEPSYHHTCAKCGARRVDRQIGLEAIPDCGRAASKSNEMELREDLTDDDRRYVIAELMAAGVL